MTTQKTFTAVRKHFKNYEKLVDINHHGAAISEIAHAVNNIEAVAQLSTLQKEHERIGFLSEKLKIERDAIEQKVKEQFQKMYGFSFLHTKLISKVVFDYKIKNL